MSYEKTVIGVEKSTNRRNLIAMSAVILALASACGEDRLTAADIKSDCAPKNSLPLPASASVDGYQDKRHGDILPCFYLNDMGIPYNTETPLIQLQEQMFSESEFNSRGSYGGWLFFGLGSINGSNAASGKTQRKDVYAMQILGSDGTYKKLVLDAEIVSLKPCEDDCKPSIKIEVANTTLFKKGDDDNSSIWESDSPVDDSWKRYNTVASVANLLPRETTESDVNSNGSVTGGPKMPGAVVSALASKIIVTLPKKLLETPQNSGQ